MENTAILIQNAYKGKKMVAEAKKELELLKSKKKAFIYLYFVVIM